MTIVKRQDTTPQPVAEGRQRYLAYTEDLMVVVFEFEGGPTAQPDPPHNHPHQQITYVAEGEVLFFIEGVPHRLAPGDLITVPSNVPHSIQLLTERVRLVDTFSPIRTDFL